MRASDDCCMDSGNYSHDYTYTGGGLGVGAKYGGGIALSVGEQEISTKCIGWQDWIGGGRVTTVGAGFIIGYGVLWATTPQSYNRFTGSFMGFDLSDITTVGVWDFAEYEKYW